MHPPSRNQQGHTGLESTARQTCDESQPFGLDKLLYQARGGGARPTPAPGRQLVTKAANGA